MIKTAFLTIMSASSITAGATDAFNSVRSSALDMANVYAIAGEVSEGAFYGDNSAEARLYAAAERLYPVADFTLSDAQMAQLGI